MESKEEDIQPSLKSDNQTNNLFQRLFLEIPDNKFCFECGLAANWASVNNGIFLCMNCASIHKNFGIEISYIKSIELDFWDESSLNRMIQGGNVNLRAVFDYYNISWNKAEKNPEDMKKKYSTKCCHYYRTKLTILVNGARDFSLEKPSIEDGQQQMAFQQYEQEQNLKNKLGNVFNKTADVTKQFVQNVNYKIQQTDWKNEMKLFGQVLALKTQQIGEKVKETSKESYQKLKNLTNKSDQSHQEQEQTQKETPIDKDENLVNQNQNNLQEEEKKQEKNAVLTFSDKVESNVKGFVSSIGGKIIMGKLAEKAKELKDSTAENAKKLGKTIGDSATQLGKKTVELAQNGYQAIVKKNDTQQFNQFDETNQSNRI